MRRNIKRDHNRKLVKKQKSLLRSFWIERNPNFQVKALNTEISDIQEEFQNDRDEYLETIRNLEQQEKLLQQIIDRLLPTVRKDCNYA